MPEHGTVDSRASRYCAVLPFPVGRVGIRTTDDRIAEIAYLPCSVPLVAPRNRLAQRAAEQLLRYLHDPDVRFDLPLAEAGTDFQRRVWHAIRAIPRGRTETYGRIAQALQSAPRAVGQACGANGLPLVIPCHRVVGAAGLGGFAHRARGFHLEVKHWLLMHERALPEFA